MLYEYGSYQFSSESGIVININRCCTNTSGWLYQREAMDSININRCCTNTQTANQTKTIPQGDKYQQMLYEYSLIKLFINTNTADKYQQMLYEYLIRAFPSVPPVLDKYQQMLYEYSILMQKLYLTPMININRCCTNTYYLKTQDFLLNW